MIILCTDSLRGYGLNRIFELTKKAQYDGIDLNVDYGQFDTYNANYLCKLKEEYGLPIHAVSAPNQIAAKRIQELVEVTKKIEAKVLVLQPPKLLDFKLASWLKTEIPKLREKEFLSIALENAPAGTFLGFIPEHAMSNAEELKKFKHISLDTARIGEKKQDLIRAYAAFKKYLVHIHISNVYHGKKYAPLQEGILPLESFLAKLKQDKYPGALSIKIQPKFLHAGEDEQVVEELQRAKKYYEKYYEKIDISQITEKKKKINLARDKITGMIKLKNVSKKFAYNKGFKEAISNISLNIKKGEFIAIVGPSGSGKTTLLNIIGGLDTPTKGEITFNKKNLNRLNDDSLSEYRNKEIGFVFQEFHLEPHLTIKANILLPTFFQKKSKNKETLAKKLIKEVKLLKQTKSKAQELSGGEKQRTAIARALINNPKIILADEPTGNLDAETGKTIIDILKNLHKNHDITLIIATHDPKIAKAAQRTIKISAGKLIK